uniref:Uncharacterized protein n=1 Tax=Ditylenchus dipsaci TaxID=166011 RepID=A0A915DTU2_9BILA
MGMQVHAEGIEQAEQPPSCCSSSASWGRGTGSGGRCRLRICTGIEGLFAGLPAKNSTLVQAFCQSVATQLDQRHQRHQHGDHGQHDLAVEALVAIPVGDVAQPSGTDRPGHGRGVDQGHQGDGETADNARQRFGQQHMPDNVPAPATHGLRGFHQAMVDFAQADLGDPAKNGVAAMVSGTTAAHTP